MQSNKTRIRKDFAPLTVAVSIRCTTPASPLTQVFNGENSEYEPDREITPTTILPEVVANATDGSWSEPHSNAALANMKWYVNGVDIATLTDWTDKYSIDQVGSTRGAITIMRNVGPGEQIALHFEAELADTRLGVVLPIVTDKVILTTSEKSADAYSVSLSDGANVQYDPLKDKLAEYDYKVAHGIINADATQEKAATDKNAYYHTFNFQVYKGKTPLSSGNDYSIELYRINSPSSLTKMSAGNAECLVIAPTAIVLDLRVITKSTYLLLVKVDSIEVARTQFGVSRVYQNYDMQPTNGTDIHPSDTQRYDEVQAMADGAIIRYPGRIFKIDWYTDTYAQKGVHHNEGASTLINLADTGIGDTDTDSWMEVYVESEYKAAHSYAVDSSGNQFTNSSNQPFIFT